MTPEFTGIDDNFRAEFPTWQHLRAFVANQARYPEFSEDRALRQIIMADLTTRLSTDNEWLLLGSLGLPPRVPDSTADVVADLHIPEVRGIDPAYVLPRTAFDLDLYAAGIAARIDPADTGAEYGREVQAALAAAIAPADQPGAATGRGLGGLVAYTPGELREYPNGQVMGTIIAQPIDPRYSTRSVRAADDALTIEIDIKPPSKIVFQGEPEVSTRPINAVALPGFHPVQPRLYPVAEQLADKVCLLSGPPVSLRDAPQGPWHRYKDLVDSYFLIRTTPMSAPAVRQAIETNWNLRRLGLDSVPHPYRVYGQSPAPAGEATVPWREGCADLVKANPQLRRYPTFDGMIKQVAQFVDTVPASAAGRWAPGRGWETPRTLPPIAAAFPQSTRQAVQRKAGAPPAGRPATPPRHPGRGPAPER